MYKLKKCALCDEITELKLSHIVPKFIGRHLKGTSIGNIRSAENGRIVQDLEKHYMLCHDCEEKFSAAEKWFANNVFYPWQKNNTDIFHYDNKLFYFLTSLSWRSLYLDILDFVEHNVCSVSELDTLIKSENLMKSYLLDKSENIGNIEHHIFFFERIENLISNNEMFSYNPHATIHRSVTSYTVTYTNGTIFTISNLMGIIVVTFYAKNSEENWQGTQIYNRSDTLCANGQCISSVVGNEMNYWLESAQNQYEKLSKEQKEKIWQKIIDIGEDIKNYNIYQDYIDDINLK